MDIQLTNNQMCEEFFDLLFTNRNEIMLMNSVNNMWAIFKSSYLICVVGSNMKESLCHFSFPDNIDEYLKTDSTHDSVLFADIPLSFQKTIKQIIGRTIIECFNWNSNITIYFGIDLPGRELIAQARSLEEAIIQLELKNGIEV